MLDTMVNPGRPIAATEVHLIKDDDVRDAPTFEAIAGDVARAVADCVVAAYNVYFDMPFLRYELSRSGVSARLPHACVMWLRPLLGLGARCCLNDACRLHGIAAGEAHAAADDAIAAARLLTYCLGVAREAGFATFDDLAGRAAYAFLDSFDDAPLDQEIAERLPPGTRRRSRNEGREHVSSPGPPARSGRALYWDALLSVLADLHVTDDEIALLAATQHDAGVSAEDVRALHARAYAHAITQVIEDRRLDERECALLQPLHRALHRLGWAPGEPCTPA